MLVTEKLNTIQERAWRHLAGTMKLFFVHVVCIPACSNEAAGLLYSHHHTAGSGDSHCADTVLSRMHSWSSHLLSVSSCLISTVGLP